LISGVIPDVYVGWRYLLSIHFCWIRENPWDYGQRIQLMVCRLKYAGSWQLIHCWPLKNGVDDGQLYAVGSYGKVPQQ
jgi:hypothetical protein